MKPQSVIDMLNRLNADIEADPENVWLHRQANFLSKVLPFVIWADGKTPVTLDAVCGVHTLVTIARRRTYNELPVPGYVAAHIASYLENLPAFNR